MRGTPDLSQLEMFPHVVPFSFSQPHCTSDLGRKENCIVLWSPALGQMEECSPQSGSHRPHFQPNTKALSLKEGPFLGQYQGHVQRVGLKDQYLSLWGLQKLYALSNIPLHHPTTLLSEACLPEVCLQPGVIRAKGRLLG